ncbi:phosphoserine phosphatase [Aureococcus anophagefferens]|uniref:Phosphoserine phosphatase n=1 Tax=Aureococcus anophagefferens TaxID=44056 RepID=A0ABR1GDJ2_AURAN
MATAQSIEATKVALRGADADSTLISEEGIDVLAAHCGAGEAVAAWTAKAMGGGVKFEGGSPRARRAHRAVAADVEACLAAHPPQAKPPADAFLGFGGVAVRDVVRDSADWFVTDFADVVALALDALGADLAIRNSGHEALKMRR